MDVRAELGVGFGFDGGVTVGFGEGLKVGFGVGNFTETPLFQINFLPDLIQVNILP